MKPTTSKLFQSARSVIPPLNPSSHKGQAGRLAVIGGCKEYTGAPFFASLSSLKVGADLSHVFCTEGAATAIKSYSPDLIVHPYFFESDCASTTKEEETKLKEREAEGVKKVASWFPRLHVAVFGPGMGRDPAMINSCKLLIAEARAQNLPVVIDGDGLFAVSQSLDIIKGYEWAILTPNRNEYLNLEKLLGTSSAQDMSTRLGNVTIIQKGEKDIITNGKTTVECSEPGTPRRVGGQGDILAGSVGIFLFWAKQKFAQSPTDECFEGLSPTILAAYAATLLVRRTGNEAFKKHKRAMTTSDMLAIVGSTFDSLFESQPISTL
eukprot:TRINITY_DN12578_c0_g1_i1.p1 TRINITY_DN12578_c0_g1~~TRINITY_DN12578_c0_g1_i1.p1  ORF type:complete len:323 (-),score=74.63 TRINITY_DN12578_c0_g1_i1:59-1027(-)